MLLATPLISEVARLTHKLDSAGLLTLRLSHMGGVGHGSVA